MAAIPVPANHVLDLRQFEPEWHVVYAGAGPSADPILLLWRLPVQYRHVPADELWRWNKWEIWHHFRAGANQFRVIRLVGNELVQIDLAPDQPSFSFVQPLSDGRLVAIFSRSGENDCNAVVYSRDGIPEHSFHAGDAIEDVQVDQLDRIWISFFDECLSRKSSYGCGLIVLNSSGELLTHIRRELLPDRGIVDIHALNVSGDSAWIYYYLEERSGGAQTRRDFDLPLVRIGFDRTIQAWEGLTDLVDDLLWWKSLAFLNGRILFAGAIPQYDREVDHELRIVHRRPRAPELTSLVHLVDLDNRKMNAFAPYDSIGTALQTDDAFGRGPVLFIRDSGQLFAIHMKNLLNSGSAGALPSEQSS